MGHARMAHPRRRRLFPFTPGANLPHHAADNGSTRRAMAAIWEEQMRSRMAFSCTQLLIGASVLALMSTASARPFTDPRSDKLDVWDKAKVFSALPRDPACYTSKLVATGGAAPNSPQTLAVRWTGYSNYELAYKGKVILLDAYFDRGAILPKLG